MSGSKKKTPAEELIESLLKDMVIPFSTPESLDKEENEEIDDATKVDFKLRGLIGENDYESEASSEFVTNIPDENNSVALTFDLDSADATQKLAAAMGALQAENVQNNQKNQPKITKKIESEIKEIINDDEVKTEVIKTEVINSPIPIPTRLTSPNPNLQKPPSIPSDDSEKTVAVAGYQVRSDSNYEDKVKISVGQNRMSSGYQAWNNSGSADSKLAQAENLQIAQEKIIDLELENDKLRLQNEELMAASEIIKERSDLLSAQLNEYKNDREGLEDSFKNEIVLLRNHLSRKDAELHKAQFKTEELDSRLKFDMKKIRIRERELENRLELIRAEKNAIVKNKDEQILDLRRKMDILQMEVESYRQKCVDLNKSVESSQESFKRTTRALRLAMANLELQEENKVPLKKVD